MRIKYIKLGIVTKEGDFMRENGLEKKNRGITLIALVVTIVVLLILSGVSINMLLGNNGIITMAQKAKNEYEEAKKREERELAGVFEKKIVTYHGALHLEDGQLLNQYNEEIQLKRFSWNSSLKIF